MGKTVEHKITLQPGDTLIVEVEDPELEELEDDEEEDDVLGDDDDDDDDDEDEVNVEDIPQDVLEKELERRKQYDANTEN